MLVGSKVKHEIKEKKKIEEYAEFERERKAKTSTVLAKKNWTTEGRQHRRLFTNFAEKKKKKRMDEQQMLMCNKTETRIMQMQYKNDH